MDQSPFQKLPGEIRNYIWELALIEPASLRVLKLPHRPQGGPRSLIPTNRHRRALTQTCKQIRSETHSIYWSGNSFIVSLDECRRSTAIYAVVHRSIAVMAPLTDFVAFIEGCNLPRLGSMTVEHPIDHRDLRACYYSPFRKGLYGLMKATMSREGMGLAKSIVFAIDFEYLKQNGNYGHPRIVIEGSSMAMSLRNGAHLLWNNDDANPYDGFCLQSYAIMLEEWQQWYEAGV